MSIIAISGKMQSGKNTVASIIQCLHYIHKNNITNLTVQDLLNDMNLDVNLTGWKQVAFADKLKDIVCLLINCTREQLEDQEFKNKELGEEWWYYLSPDNIKYNYSDAKYNEHYDSIVGICKLIKLTPRLLLQQIGTDLFREQLHPNIWVSSLMSVYKPIEPIQHIQKKLYHNEELTFPNWLITDLRFSNELEAVKARGGITIRVNKVKKAETLKFELEEGIIPHESEIALDNAVFDYVIDNNSNIESLIEKVKKILINEKII